MDGAIRASVVIVTYEHREAIGTFLDRLLPTLGPEDEVVIVDNASTDGTADVVAPRAGPIRLHRAGRNGGYGAGANLAARSARGRALVFLGVDAYPRAGWLDALVGALDQTGGDALVGARTLLARTPERVDALGLDVHVSGIPASREWGRRVPAGVAVEEVPSISGTCFAIDRGLYEKLGGFDERLFLYWEDIDLALRARLAGHPCLVTPRAEVLHDHRPGTPPAKLFYLERNRIWGILKLYRWRTIAGLLPVLAVAEVLTWAFALASGPAHVAAKVHAWADVVRWLPDLAAARSRAARTRRLSDRDLLRLHSTRLPLTQIGSGPLAALGESASTAIFALARLLVDLVAA